MLPYCCLIVSFVLDLSVLKSNNMKKILFAVALAFSVVTVAQSQKPTIEKLDNDTVKVTYYHENGQVAQTGTFVNKERHGEWTSFDTNGSKVTIAQYSNDKRTGKWIFFNENKITEVDYNQNAVASVNTYVSETQVVKNKP